MGIEKVKNIIFSDDEQKILIETENDAWYELSNIKIESINKFINIEYNDHNHKNDCCNIKNNIDIINDKIRICRECKSVYINTYFYKGYAGKLLTGEKIGNLQKLYPKQCICGDTMCLIDNNDIIYPNIDDDTKMSYINYVSQFDKYYFQLCSKCGTIWFYRDGAFPIAGYI
jgi:hypothetical protein